MPIRKEESGEFDPLDARDASGLAALTREVRKGFESIKQAMHDGDIRFVQIESLIKSTETSIEDLNHRLNEINGKFGTPGERSLDVRLSLIERESRNSTKELEKLKTQLWAVVFVVLVEVIGGIVGLVLLGRGGP